MARYTRTQVTQLSANEQAAINNINKNFEDLEAAIQDTVSRSGNTPTHMTHDLDMNGKRIINVPAPTVDTDLVRRKDVVEDMNAVQTLVNTATNASSQALEAAQAVQEVLEDSHLVIVADDLALGDDSKIKKVADDIDDVSNVADNMSAINTANSNITNIDKVADDINNVNTTATNINNVNTCANNISAIQDAPNQASAAAGSAGDASGYATAAAASAREAAEAAAGIKLPLLWSCWFDHQLNDISWLRADTFSWQSGAVYKAVYDHLLNDVGYVRYMIPDDGFNIKFYRAPDEDTEMYAWTNSFSTLYTESEFPQNGDDFYYHNQVYGTVLSIGVEAGSGAITPTTETIGSYTITYYPAEDGHKIVLSDQETTVANIYNESGVAWYYILDTTNQRFKLPRTKYGFTGLRDAVGKYVEAGVPNITGSFVLNGTEYDAKEDGAFYLKSQYNTNANTGHTDNGWSPEVGFDASKLSSIYGNNTTVQPPATQMYLYFYVGQFTQTATEQTAGLNSELFNGKVDIDSSWGFPSDNYDGLTLGASGTEYTAPANGWVILGKRVGASAAQYISVFTDSFDFTTTIKGDAGNEMTAICPVRKGDTFKVNYNATGETTRFRFIYAEGSESEASQ